MTTKPIAIKSRSSKLGKRARKVNVNTWGDLSPTPKGNPVREDRLRWQESAEAIVPGVFFREGPNNEKDEYDEQFVGRTRKAETFG
jgi:hypothetical protein